MNKGMDKLIHSTLKINSIAPSIKEGYYKLFGNDGKIILPSDWERVVMPGLVVYIGHMGP